MPQRSSFKSQDYWVGRHQSYKQRIEGYHRFQVYQPPKAERLQEYNRITKELQRLIKQALQNGKTLRAMGSSWSLSKVGMTKHELINTKNLCLAFSVNANHIVPSYNGDSQKLRFVETGAEIGTINRYLFQHRLSLKASGSNDGQTLAGVISTNTHGSAFKFGSVQDFVVGLHLITGPNSHVFLQRDSHQVIKESFTKKLGAKLLNDDTLFNAALVSFGSFGIIHGMMIEARPLFLLRAQRKFLPFGPALKKAMTTLDFSGYHNHFDKVGEKASKLYHFQVTFNPNEAKKGKPPKEGAVFFMWERNYREDYEPPPWDQGGAGPGASGLELVGNLIELIPGPLKSFVKKKINEQVRDLYEYDITGTFLDLFRGEQARGKVFASGIGIPISRSLDVLEIAFKTYEKFGTVLPVLFTIRFVKGTKALLGFTKFKPTCVLEIDGINTPKTHEFANQVWQKLEKADIPFTMHWGKFNTFLTPDRIQAMYGDNAQKWINSRETLIKNPEVRKVFTNDFLTRVGLAT